MNIELLANFFAYSSLIHFILLLLSSLGILFFRDKIAQLHARFFGLQPEDCQLCLYRYLATYKICFIFFSFVPFITLKYCIS